MIDQLSSAEWKQIQLITDKKPLFFFDNVLCCPYWDMQAVITNAVFENMKVAVKSCHGAGKSYIAARIAIAFLSTYPDSIVVTTAPTFRQVKDILWREINGAYARSKVPLGGRIFTTKFEVDDNWYGIGVSSDKSDNMQGYHAPSGHILVIGDEAAGIPVATAEAMQALLTSSGSRLLYIGNPTNVTSDFYASFLDNSFVHLSIPAFITPNFIAAGIKSTDDLEKFKTLQELRDHCGESPFPFLIDPLWAWGRLKKWGRNSPMYISRICAEFPAESDVTLIPHYMVERCLIAEFGSALKAESEKVRSIGVDVARRGSNKTVITVLDKLEVLEVEWYTGRRIPETVAAIKNQFEKHGFDKRCDVICVDDTGVGGGVTDALLEEDYLVEAVNFGGAPTEGNQRRFVNIKAEMFWYLRETMEHGGIKILDEGDLLKQLPTIQYKYTSQQKLQIISKEEMEKAGLESPDFADSLALAVWGTKFGSSYITPAGDDEDKYSPSQRGIIGGNLFARKF